MQPWKMRMVADHLDEIASRLRSVGEVEAAKYDEEEARRLREEANLNEPSDDS